MTNVRSLLRRIEHGIQQELARERLSLNRIETTVAELRHDASSKLAVAVAVVGWSRIEGLNASPSQPLQVGLSWSRTAGGDTPRFHLCLPSRAPRTGTFGTNAAVDNAREAFADLARSVTVLASCRARVDTLEVRLESIRRRLFLLQRGNIESSGHLVYHGVRMSTKRVQS